MIRHSRKLLVNQDPMARSFLDIVSAVLDVLKAVDAYRNGEPGMIVVWMGASAIISAISGILAFYALNAWWSFDITLVLAVITIALAILTMQELTLPQRLWVHRSVFGRPNHNYYNSEPFGGDKPRSLPNDPAAADEWKDYQRRALNEEAQALGMLVTGITLEVSIIRINEGATAIILKLDSTVKNAILTIKLSIPKNIDGDISLDIVITNPNQSNLSSLKRAFVLSLRYRKETKNIIPISCHKGINELESKEKDNFILKSINIDITFKSKININLKIFEKDKPFILMASDKIKA